MHEADHPGLDPEDLESFRATAHELLGACIERLAARPSYLESQERVLGSGEPWFCDYGIDLSRGGRTLKVWTALQHYGPERLGECSPRIA